MRRTDVHRITLLLLFGLWGCNAFDGKGCPPGEEGCPCDFDFCHGNLICDEDVCALGPSQTAPPRIFTGPPPPMRPPVSEPPPPTMPPVPSDGSVPCGPTVCVDPATMIPLPVALPDPCCVDAAEGICGTIDESIGLCEPPPENHPVCPPLITGFGIDAPSCCFGPTFECGLIAPPPLGDASCVPLREVIDMIAGLVPVPTPIDCEGNLLGAPDDDAGRPEFGLE